MKRVVISYRLQKIISVKEDTPKDSNYNYDIYTPIEKHLNYTNAYEKMSVET